MRSINSFMWWLVGKNVYPCYPMMSLSVGGVLGCPLCKWNSRLSFRGVFRYGDGEGGVSELWWSGPSHHGHNSRGTAAAQPVGSHHGQQVLPVALQRKPRGSYLAALPVHFKTTITSCREKQKQKRKEMLADGWQHEYVCLSPGVRMHYGESLSWKGRIKHRHVFILAVTCLDQNVNVRNSWSRHKTGFSQLP